MADKEKFLGLFDKETTKKIAKYGIIGAALLGLLALL